jgi:ADP-heptose:LPS heptosyltransferase
MVKFLVVRFSSIGDILLTTPVVRHLKRQVDQAEIHYLTKSAFTSLLEENPYVDRVHAFNGDLNHTARVLKEIGFDYIIDLHHNARTQRLKMKLKRMDFSVNKLNFQKWLYVNLRIDRLPEVHMVDRNLATIRNFITERDEEGLDYFIPSRDEIDPGSLPSAFQSGYIALAIGAQHQTKRLPEDLLVELCSSLNHPVIILGGNDDQHIADSVMKALPGKHILNHCGALNIHQSASLVRQSRLLITHDTGLMHIGAAFKKKIISVWGNTVPKFGMYPYKADEASVRYEVNGLRCRPCSKIGFQECPKKHFRCMREQDISGISQDAVRLFAATGQ